MKNQKLTFTTLLCALFISLTVSSCLDSDNDDRGGFTISRTDSIAAMQSVQGSYTGKLYYYDPAKASDNTYKGDSVDINWSVRNTLQTQGELTITNLPVNILAVFLTKSHSLDMSKEILGAATTQTFNTYVKPYGKVSSSIATLYMYTIVPKNLEMTFDVNYENTRHSVKVMFANAITTSDNYYYYPVAQKVNSTFQGNVLIDKVVIDGVEYKIASPFGFKGKSI